MPWSKGDVDKHKKGLTDQQKSKWVEIANSVLQTCLENGGDRSECEGKAVRTANSRVGGQAENMEFAQYDRLVKNVETGELHTLQLENEDHLVVPVVMLVEGVHNGSVGPVLYEKEEMSRYPVAWNGRAIPLWHPDDGNGNCLSANSPEEWEQRRLGWVFNTRVDQKGPNGNARLKADAWLNKSDLENKAPEVLAALNNGQTVEVSTGIIADWELVSGDWNGEHYDKIARNMRPDHLAILPSGKGACSIEDGAGLLRNQESDNGGLAMNVMQTARTPFYDGRTSEKKPSTDLSSFVSAWNLSAASWDRLTEKERERISGTSLLGNQNAESFQAGLCVPCVVPATGELSENALRDVISNKGMLADLSDEVRKSAQRKAYDLLNKEFGAGLDVPEGLQEKGFFRKVLNWLNPNFGANENGSDLSHDDVRQRLGQALDSAVGGKDIFVHPYEVFDNYVVYFYETPQDGEKLYRQSYSIDESGDVTLEGTVEEVKVKTEVVPVNDNEESGGTTMNREKLIAGLIANTEVFTEDDRKFLEGKEDKVLNDLHEKYLKEPEGGTAGNEDPDKGGVVQDPSKQNQPSGNGGEDRQQPVTLQGLLQNADQNLRETILEGQRELNEKRTQFINAITNAEGCQFTKEELEVMSTNQLRQTAALAGNKADMQGRIGALHQDVSPTSDKPKPLGCNRRNGPDRNAGGSDDDGK